MKESLTIPEIARRLGVSERTVRRRLRDGAIRRAAMGERVVRIAAIETERVTRRDGGEIGNEPVHTGEQVVDGQTD